MRNKNKGYAYCEMEKSSGLSIKQSFPPWHSSSVTRTFLLLFFFFLVFYFFCPAIGIWYNIFPTTKLEVALAFLSGPIF